MLAPFKTGDIIYQPGVAGHIQMIYQGQADTIPSSRSSTNCCIHSQNEGGFHINRKDNLAEGDRVFRYIGLMKEQQIVLRRIADLIAVSSEYRLAGIGKLVFSSSKDGKYSKERLNKYSGRLAEFLLNHKLDIEKMNEKEWRVVVDNLGDIGLKLVSKATCSEAVVLCYQLASQLLSPKVNAGYYIHLSARGTLPRTLRDYLGRTGGWKDVTDDMRPRQGFGMQPKVVQGFGLPVKTNK